MKKINGYVRLLRSNASLELNIDTYEITTFNFEMDLLSFWHPAKGAGNELHLAAGVIEYSRDLLMNNQSYLSLTTFEYRMQEANSLFKKKKLYSITGGGVNTLTYKNRQYTDGSTAHVLELMGLWTVLGVSLDLGNPMTFAVSAEGDIGITNGFVFDAQIKANYNVLLWSKNQDVYLDLNWQHDIHKNTSRSVPADRCTRVGAQLVMFFLPE